MSERELAEKIRFLKNQGLGYRRISKRLGMNKDRAFRLDRKYNTPQKINTEQEITDEEIKLLDQKIEEIEQKVKLAKAKNERENRVIALMVQDVDASFERRKELFKDKTALLDLTQKILPVIKPALWLRLTDFCDTENIELADALLTAIGSQVGYEEVREVYKKEGRDYLLDDYLCLRIEDWLSQQQDEEQEEDSGEESPSIIVEERVHSHEWIDLQGFTHITIQKTREKYYRIPLPRANADSG